jgi:hypothetical protein
MTPNNPTSPAYAPWLPTGLPSTLGTLTTQQQAAIIAAITAANVAQTVFPDGSTFSFPLQIGPPETPTYAAVVYDMLWQEWLTIMYPAIAKCRATYSQLVAAGQTAEAQQALGAAIDCGIPLNAATMIMGWGFAACADGDWLDGYTWVSAYGQPVAAGAGTPPAGSIAISSVPPVVPPEPPAAPTIYTLGTFVGSIVNQSTGQVVTGLWQTTPQSDPPVGTKITVSGMNFVCVQILSLSGFMATEALYWQLQAGGAA